MSEHSELRWCIVTARQPFSARGGRRMIPGTEVLVDIEAEADLIRSGALTVRQDTAADAPDVDATQSLAQLRSLAAQRGIDLTGRRSKAAVLEALTNHPGGTP